MQPLDYSASAVSVYSESPLLLTLAVLEVPSGAQTRHAHRRIPLLIRIDGARIRTDLSAKFTGLQFFTESTRGTRCGNTPLE